MTKNPTPVPPLFPDDERWQQCFEHFLVNIERRSGSRGTLESYRGCLRAFFSQISTHPANVTRAEVESFLARRLDIKRCKPGDVPGIATVNARRSAIRSFYSFASAYTVPGQDGRPEVLFDRANPTVGICHGTPPRSYKTLSMDELKRFFLAINGQDDKIFAARDSAIFWMFLLTCRRRSEIARLTWGDLEYGLVTDDDGSTRMAWKYHFYGKGRSTIRDCAELPSLAMDKIRHYLQVSGRWDTIKPSDPLFAAIGRGELGGNVRPGEIRQLREGPICKRLAKYAALAGIESHKLSLHSFRHSGAYLRKTSGADLLSISKVLRHKSLDMTRRYLEGLSTNSDKESRLVEARLAVLGIM